MPSAPTKLCLMPRLVGVVEQGKTRVAVPGGPTPGQPILASVRDDSHFLLPVPTEESMRYCAYCLQQATRDEWIKALYADLEIESNGQEPTASN